MKLKKSQFKLGGINITILANRTKLFTNIVINIKKIKKSRINQLINSTGSIK